MLELGFAYSQLYNLHKDDEAVYIAPFVIQPIKKSDALSNTPMANLQVGEINNVDDIRSFIHSLKEDKGFRIKSGTKGS